MAKRLWAKLKFQDMAKQIILKKAQQDRIECEKIFWRAQLIKEFFPSFCYYFDVISPKAIELFQNFFSHFFLSHHTLSRLFISFPITWNLNFVVNLVSILWNWKTLDFLEYKVPPSCKVWAQTNKKCKSSLKHTLFLSHMPTVYEQTTKEMLDFISKEQVT